MAESDIDTLMVLVQENRHYLSGFLGEDNNYDESAGALFITKDQLLLATDSRFVFQAEVEAPDFEVFCYRKGLAAELPDIASKLHSKVIGFEPVRLCVRDHERMCEALKKANANVVMQPASGMVEALRIIKDETEIDTMRTALHMAENGLKTLLTQIGPGVSEASAAWELEKILRESGAEGLSFPSIVAAGVNAAKPHAIPSDTLFAEGMPILFDWGTLLNGYCSDITRSFFFGRPDPMFMNIFNVVKTASDLATGAIRAGVSSTEVDAIARDHIRKNGFEGKFGHGLGHGVGLAIHEAPRLSPLQNTTLQAGMVVTVEPGIYLPEWGGIRLENMVVVREEGAEVLNATTVEEFLPV